MPRLLLRRHVRLYIRGSKGNSCYWIGKSVLTSAVIVCSSLLFWSALKSAAVRCCRPVHTSLRFGKGPIRKFKQGVLQTI